MKFWHITPTLKELSDKPLRSLRTTFLSQAKEKKILQFIEKIPNEIALSEIIFESPLDTKEKWIDISLRVDTQSVKNLVTKNLEWETLSSFAKKWDQQGGKKDFWAEFDLGSSSCSSYLPSLFFNTAHIHKENLFSQLMECFALSNSLLEVCIDKLGENAKISYTGFMLSRNHSPLRINVKIKDHFVLSIENYLLKIGVSPLPHPLLRCLRLLESCLTGVALAFDIVENTLSSRMGVECFIDPNDPAHLEKWKKYFDILQTVCKVDEEKISKSLKWFGGDVVLLDAESYFLRYLPIAMRSIGHVKLLYSEEKGLEAKIYLSIAYAEDRIKQPLVRSNLSLSH